MNPIRRLISWLRDPRADSTERIFVLLTIIAEVGVAIAMLGDAFSSESYVETAMLIAVVVLVPIATFLGVKHKKIQVSIHIIIICLVFVILPVVFFFGGGVEGGCVIWIVFSFLYIGLVLRGVWRTAMLAALTVLSFVGFLLEYLHPELVVQHTRAMFYIDSFISLIVVGNVIFVMVWFQSRLFQEENRRAKEETSKAEELNRAQNRFFSNMSHEIRTPINSILGLNELILRQEDASEEIIRDASNIQGAGKMLLSLINDILDFSKIEAGGMDIVPVEYRIGDMMSEIVNMVWLRASEKGLKFSVDIDPQVPSVLFGDEVRIRQILINLLNNAVKYTQEGSIALHIESEDAGDGSVLLTISVSDTGIGIKQETLPYLFDAFRRMDQEKNRYIEGTGLGLSIVKQLVDLMGGTISVNSVYTQGSTFTVTLKQGVVISKAVGDISITSSGDAARSKHEHRFSAPEAKVLIVDDNEMNLEVERKLLGDTEIKVDTAMSGAEALDKTLRVRYDIILMDHLMPVMDGIECLDLLRRQTGGLNKNIPVIVLTANAGSKDRELYNAAGFDGYLVKPVSGTQLEDMLLRHLPAEKVIRTGASSMTGEEMNTAKGYSRKLPVLISAGSMSDLPDAVISQLGLNVIPWIIHTGGGTFRDGVDISADELMRYIGAGNSNTYTEPSSVSDYVAFFGSMLKRAHHVIHIALTTDMSAEYRYAVEAAKSFENVTVINSECVSTATGLLVLVAYKLARQNQSVEKIVEELERVKKRIHCSFVIRHTDFMARRGYLPKSIHSVAKALELRPCIRLKNNKSGIGGMWMGSLRHCYDGYIHRALRNVEPDTDILFVTYVGVSEEDLAWIEERIRKLVNFDRIVFQQASAAISTNCGPGTFGLLFMEKGEKSYGLGALLPPEAEAADGSDADEQVPPRSSGPESENNAAPAGEDARFADIPGLDYAEGVKSCDSPESFRKALELFCHSIRPKADEIEGYWKSGDIQNYTVKVHALKSSARLIGAAELSERAKALEDAGRAGNTAEIDNGTPALLALYRSFSEKLEGLFANDAEDTRVPIDAEALAEAYESLAECAGMMDYGMMEAALDALKEYRLPPEDAARMEEIRTALIELDWDRIAKLAGR